ncbi:MAG: M67 family metallopeptidase [Gemmatimonadota bacterium]|nr:M67 family metallopeptidase [Gemmatimonadota bacterium]
MMRLHASTLREVNAHASVAYPEECCGVLLGRDSGNHGIPREVVRIVALGNLLANDRKRRYHIPADSVLSAEREAEAAGLTVIGFYHSHPDGTSEPSAFDLEHAWPWYGYLIVAAREGDTGPIRAWRLADDRSRFDEEELTLAEEA